MRLTMFGETEDIQLSASLAGRMCEHLEPDDDPWGFLINKALTGIRLCYR